MRTFRRRLFASVCVLSLILCLATLGMSVVSRFTMFTLASWGDAAKSRAHRVSVADGKLAVQTMWGRQPIPVAETESNPRPPSVGMHVVHERHFPFVHCSLADVVVGRTSTPSYGTVRFIWVDLVAIAVLCGILPVVRGGKIIRAWVRRKADPTRCRCCGYDLRATPARCPECGRDAVTVN